MDTKTEYQIDNEILAYTAGAIIDAVAIVAKITPSSTNLSATVEAWAIGPTGQRSRLTTPAACQAMGYRYDKRREGLRMTGCGFSRSFALAQALAGLFGDDPQDRYARQLNEIMLTI